MDIVFGLVLWGLGIVGGDSFFGSFSRKSGNPRPRYTVQKKAGYQTSEDSSWGFPFHYFICLPIDATKVFTTHAMKRRRTSILSVSGPIIRKATSVGVSQELLDRSGDTSDD